MDVAFISAILSKVGVAFISATLCKVGVAFKSAFLCKMEVAFVSSNLSKVGVAFVSVTFICRNVKKYFCHRLFMVYPFRITAPGFYCLFQTPQEGKSGSL